MPKPFLREFEIKSKSTANEGGYASVYKVKHLKLGYIRALRVLHATIEDENDPKYLQFLEECRLLLRIGNGGHRNIVRIFQPRLVDNKAFVEMEYIEGTDLYDFLAKNKGFIPMEEYYRFAFQVADALAYCHHDIYRYCMDLDEDGIEDDENGNPVITPEVERKLVEKYQVIHNDIHSKNIMRRMDGEYILLDFGLAVQNGNTVRSSTRKAGVYEYMAPEKFEDSGVLTTRTDVYAFGILMYEMLCGTVPFKLEGDAPSQIYNLQMKQMNDPVPSFFKARKACYEKSHPGSTYVRDFPKWLEEVIMKCLEKNPADRYNDCRELLDDMKMHMAESGVSADGTLNVESQGLLKGKIAALSREIEEKDRLISSLEGKLTEKDLVIENLKDNSSHSSLSRRIRELEKENESLRNKKKWPW